MRTEKVDRVVSTHLFRNPNKSAFNKYKNAKLHKKDLLLLLDRSHIIYRLLL